MMNSQVPELFLKMLGHFSFLTAGTERNPACVHCHRLLARLRDKSLTKFGLCVRGDAKCKLQVFPGRMPAVLPIRFGQAAVL